MLCTALLKINADVSSSRMVVRWCFLHNFQVCIYLNICLSVCLSIYLLIYSSIYLSICLSVYLSIYRTIHPSINLSNLSLSIYIWVNYNISLTWIKAIWGWFPLLTMIPVRSQWGRYNLPRYIYIYITHMCDYFCMFNSNCNLKPSESCNNWNQFIPRVFGQLPPESWAVGVWRQRLEAHPKTARSGG